MVFWKSVTIALEEHGKGHNTDPISWRPIALLSTLGKGLETIIATRLSYLVEEHHLLLDAHFGGRRGRSADMVMHALVERIIHAWNRGEVASALFLDVSRAFDNVSHARLLHNLKKRRVPIQIVRFLSLSETGRYTSSSLRQDQLGHHYWHSSGLTLVTYPVPLLQRRPTGDLWRMGYRTC